MNGLISDRALTNSKFEGYKLKIIDQNDAVAYFPLANRPSQSTASGKSLLSFKQVQSRISHNHLVVTKPSDGPGKALYVDADLKVILVEFAQGTNVPSFRVIYEIPKPVSTTVQDRSPEYPSCAFLKPSVVFASDGHGLLYILDARQDVQASEPLAVYELPNSYPARLHAVDAIGPDACVAVFSIRCDSDTKEEAGSSAIGSSDKYEVIGASFPIPFSTAGDQPGPVNVIWRRQGSDVPIQVMFDESTSSHFLLGGSSYTAPDQPTMVPHEPSSDEIAPIPRAGENLDGPTEKEPPPFSWMQTSDSLTIAFPLSSSTQKSAIRVLFAPRSLTLHVLGHNDAPLPPPSYTSKPLWGEISTEDSLWTWDRDAEHSYGILTLYLEKKHEGTRWPYLFQQSTESSNNPEDNVEETVDPSELYNIRESLEKYTAALRTGEDASGLGLGRGVPSLANGEMDDEVDSSVGRLVHQTWIPSDPTNASLNSHGGGSAPFTLLSIPLPGSTTSTSPSVIVKSNVDGNLFSTIASGDNNPPRWKHTKTFSALAFVIASKRDVRFTYHSTDAVFAFENGIRQGSGNVFIYNAAAKSNDLWANQAILKVTNTGSALLGVGAIKTAENLNLVVCLTEDNLVVIRGVL